VRGEGATEVLTFMFQDGTKIENFAAPALKENEAWKITLRTP